MSDDGNIVDLGKAREKAETKRKVEEDRKERNKKLVLSQKPKTPEQLEEHQARMKITTDSIKRINNIVKVLKQQQLARSNIKINIATGAINDKRSKETADGRDAEGTPPEIEE